MWEVFVFPDLGLQEEEALAKYKEMSLVRNIIMQQLGHINIEYRLYVRIPTRKAHTNHPENMVFFFKIMSSNLLKQLLAVTTSNNLLIIFHVTGL